MGFFDSFFNGDFNEGRERAYNESYLKNNKTTIPVKLIEPSTGRVLELEVTEKNDRFAKMYIDMLTTYAEGLEQYGVKWTVTGNKINIVFADAYMAESSRQAWRKKIM